MFVEGTVKAPVGIDVVAIVQDVPSQAGTRGTVRFGVANLASSLPWISLGGHARNVLMPTENILDSFCGR